MATFIVQFVKAYSAMENKNKASLPGFQYIFPTKTAEHCKPYWYKENCIDNNFIKVQTLYFSVL